MTGALLDAIDYLLRDWLSFLLIWFNNKAGFVTITGALLAAIVRDFGSVEAMQAKLSASTVAVQGSGWGWLGYNKDSKRLQLATCANQVGN